MQAAMRVTTRYFMGLTAETVRASIWLVTRMEPSSAPMPAPPREANMIPASKGPNRGKR